ncbi:MAG: enoyl-CoA hydratase/isomerase family protein [Hyphomicrobiaceae bacterium]|nr:enoyl-CoA hydratase/isomerase family protein [Hyphomicrobiaceae bacterium]
MSSDAKVHYEVTDHIAEITLDRPPVNAFSVPFLDQILAAFRRAGEDESIRAVILRSALPDRFCAGLDLDIILGNTALGVREFLQKLYIDLWDIQTKMGKPTIAAVNGAARGGGMTLAISCDVIVAADSATFGYPEIDLAVLPAIHFAHLPRIVGRYRAFDLLFTGRTFDASEAAQLGLVSRVVAGDTFRDETLELARTFASKSPTAMRTGRAAFMRATDLDYTRSVANAVEDFCNIAVTPDAQEGLTAFLEKRKPNWE